MVKWRNSGIIKRVIALVISIQLHTLWILDIFISCYVTCINVLLNEKNFVLPDFADSEISFL